MSGVWGKRPAIIKVELTSKRVGAEDFRVHRAGAKCSVERSYECMGQFVVWFPGHRYIKVDADQMTATIEYTDGKPQY